MQLLLKAAGRHCNLAMPRTPPDQHHAAPPAHPRRCCFPPPRARGAARARARPLASLGMRLHCRPTLPEALRRRRCCCRVPRRPGAEARGPSSPWPGARAFRPGRGRGHSLRRGLPRRLRLRTSHPPPPLRRTGTRTRRNRRRWFCKQVRPAGGRGQVRPAGGRPARRAVGGGILTCATGAARGGQSPLQSPSHRPTWRTPRRREGSSHRVDGV